MTLLTTLCVNIKYYILLFNLYEEAINISIKQQDKYIGN